MTKDTRVSKNLAKLSRSQSPKSADTGRPHGKATSIEEQENEDLEVDEGLEDGIPEQPGNVPRH